jgi:hypothetical protein
VQALAHGFDPRHPGAGQDPEYPHHEVRKRTELRLSLE